MQLVVRERNGNSATYDILDDSGVVVRTVSRDVSAELAIARASHRSLADVLADMEAATPALLAPSPVDLKPREASTVLAPNEAETGGFLLPHAHDLIEHDHPHAHEDVNSRLGKLREDMNVDHALLGERLEHHAHPEHSHEELWTRTRELGAAVKTQQEHSHGVAPMPKHEHVLAPHEHSTALHTHDDYAGRTHAHDSAAPHGHAASDLRLEELEAIAFRWRDWEGKDAAPHEHDYAPSTHEHEVPVHRHASMDGLIAEVAGLTEQVNVHGHPHKHDDLTLTVDELGRRVARLANQPAEHEHKLPPHGHEGIVHTHAAIEGAVGDLQSAIALQAAHTHEHAHEGYVTVGEYTVLLERVLTLQASIETLAAKLGTHDHKVAPHDHDLPAHEHNTYHEHPELRLILSDHIDAVKRHANWEVMAEQEVSGRTQLVVREVK